MRLIKRTLLSVSFLSLVLGLSACSPVHQQTKEKITHASVREQIILPSDELFYPGTSTFKLGATSLLQPVINMVKARRHTHIVISAYSDNIGVGSKASTQHLTQHQAERVLSYLWAQGVNKQRLIARGYGSSHFIATNETAEGSAKNRRIDVIVKW